MAATNKPKDSPMIARRMDEIQPFHVMALLARARELESQGRDIVHMEIGEPDFTAPQAVADAGIAALQAGQTHYTPALGLSRLRQGIADYYRQHYGLKIDPRRIVVTPGASGALQLLMGVLVNPGDEVLLSDPGYPCNRHFVRLMEGCPRMIPVGAESRFQLDEALLAEHWTETTRAALLASPANPTGTLIDKASLQAMADFTAARKGALIVDEIYHGLEYGEPLSSAACMGDNVFVINSFSKYFAMTGWRIGWLIAPEAYIEAIDRLAQNLFLAPSTPGQYAALAALEPENLAVLDQRREVFKQRRDYLLPALRELGFEVPCEPEGAFYIYADCSRFCDDSYRFSRDLLEQAGVAITPGIDFGDHQAQRYVRFAYTTSIDRLELGIQRIAGFIR